MSLSGKTIVFTGTLTEKRNVATALAVAAGAKVTGSISGKTDIVVAGSDAGSKLAEAKAKGVAVWTEAEFTKAANSAARSAAAPKKAPQKRTSEASPASEPPKKAARAEVKTPAAKPTTKATAAQSSLLPIPVDPYAPAGFSIFSETVGSVTADYAVMLGQFHGDSLDHDTDKFYAIQLLVNESSGKCGVLTRWGKSKTPGQHQFKECTSVDAAKQLFCKTFSEKTKNNFNHVAQKGISSFVEHDGKYKLSEWARNKGDLCCPSFHKLKPLDTSLLKKVQDHQIWFYCDGCGATVTFQELMACRPCNFDYCSKCARQNARK